MDSEAKQLVEKITSDPEAMTALTEALAAHVGFARALIRGLNKAVRDGCVLEATELRR
ncbi:MAG: hypothetical protein ACRD88_17670 [Terriglobia bacterium]